MAAPPDSRLKTPQRGVSMADTPEQRLDDMAHAVADALGLLRLVIHQLPIPIALPLPERGTPHQEFTDSIERVRELLEYEPTDEHAVAHIDQAALGILTSMDLVRVAVDEGTTWRYDAVMMACTMAVMNLRLARMIMAGEME